MINEIQKFEQALARDKQSVLRRLSKYTRIYPPTGCHIWDASLNTGGYPIIGLRVAMYKNSTVLVHRLNYYLANPTIYDANLYVLHKCDVRRCVNPDHMFLGNNQDNMSDCKEKGRTSKGEDHAFAILSENQALAIKELWNSGNYTRKELSKQFNICTQHVGKILLGKKWKHLV